MRKLFLLSTLLLMCFGVAQAQNVYFSGQSGNTAIIWKNDSLIHSLSNDSLFVKVNALQVVDDSTIYSAGYLHDTSFSFVKGYLWLNDSILFLSDSSTCFNNLIVNGNGWTVAGIGENEWEQVTGLVWQNDSLLYAYSDSTYSNQIVAMAIDTVTGDIYTGGTSSELESRAAIWKNDTLLWRSDSLSAINAIAFADSCLYSAGFLYSEGYQATLWRNDSILFAINSENAGFNAIALYDTSLYLAGYYGDSLVIWQDGEMLYSHPFSDLGSTINTLVVNEFGVYYAGLIDSIATVWKDGEILYQPEGCDYVNTICVLPSPPAPPTPEATIDVMANDTLWGSATGSGIFPVGDTITLEAFPNVGCEFLYWHDSIADNPRDIIVMHDSTFTAIFGRIEYLIETNVAPENAGIVTGGGIYHYNDTLSLEALPNAGFVFEMWSDGLTDNPRSIIVTQNQALTAIFGIKQCVVTTLVEPDVAGIVTGGGTYAYGDTVHLFAQNHTGYVFNMWSDGVIDNPRQVIVEEDITFTALFTPLQYVITTGCMPEEGGTVEGGGTYDYGTLATLRARPFNDYTFICWSDGIVSNPRYLTVTHDVSLNAIFRFDGIYEYTINVFTNDPNLGTVTGGGTYVEGTSIQISATPAENAKFVGWDDGNTDNPRTVVVDSDKDFTALFELIPTYTITVISASLEMGSVYGGGSYHANTMVSIGAIPAEGYHFNGWQDGDMNNPRSITVTENAEYIAYFSQIPPSTYTVTVYFDENQGFILGSGTYSAGSTATLAAIPADGYYFVKWSDGTTDNPKEVVVDHDIELSAFFNGTGVDESEWMTLSLYPNPAKDKIRVEGLEGAHEAEIFNQYGMLVRKASINGSTEISVNDLAAGLYLLRIDGYTAKFMKF